MARSRAEAVWLFAMRRRPLTEWLGGVPWRSILAIVFWEQALIRVVSVGTERLCWPRSGCARLRAGESAGPIGSMTWRRWMPPFSRASFVARLTALALTHRTTQASVLPSCAGRAAINRALAPLYSSSFCMTGVRSALGGCLVG